MIFTGPAAEKIIEFQFVRLVIFTKPATEKNLEFQFVRFVIFTGSATEKNFGVAIRKVHDLYWACHGKKLSSASL